MHVASRDLDDHDFIGPTRSDKYTSGPRVTVISFEGSYSLSYQRLLFKYGGVLCLLEKKKKELRNMTSFYLKFNWVILGALYYNSVHGKIDV